MYLINGSACLVLTWPTKFGMTTIVYGFTFKIKTWYKRKEDGAEGGSGGGQGDSTGAGGGGGGWETWVWELWKRGRGLIESMG